AQCLVGRVQDKAATTGSAGICVDVGPTLADRIVRDAEMIFIRRQERAGRQSHQIMRERQPASLIEIVYTPDQPSLSIAPGAKVLRVKIPNGKHDVLFLGSKFGALLRPQLRPAVERRAQKLKGIVRHRLMLLFDLEIEDFLIWLQPFL